MKTDRHQGNALTGVSNRRLSKNEKHCKNGTLQKLHSYL